MLRRATLRSVPSNQMEARNATHLRRLNLEQILAVAMDRPDSFTRAELVRATGLSAPTVGTLSTHLIRKGILRDLGTGPSSGGRRPSFMEFNARHGFVAGIDLGPTKTRLAVADLRGERLAHRVMSTPASLGPVRLLSRVVAGVRSLLKEAHVPREKLLAVAAGAPGAVDRDHGIVVDLAPNLEGWSQVPMRDILRRALQTPVIVENDVNLAVLGEHWRGAAQGHDTCAFITVGTGIGAGVVVGGQLHRGHHFLAGEIAFMCMGPQFVEHDFRPHGCLETLAGLKALAERLGHATDGSSERWIAEIFEATQAGNRRARNAIEDAATMIGIAAANLSLVLDPSLIVLGGALATQGETFVSEVRRVVARVVPVPIQIQVSSLGAEAALWGGLLVATTEARERLRQQLRAPAVA